MAYNVLVPTAAVVLIKEPGAHAERHLLALARRQPGHRPGRGRAHEAREGEEEEGEGGGVHFAALESHLTSASPLLPAI